MTSWPEQVKIYHITHVDNLVPIIRSGGLLSDRRLLQGRGPEQSIGMSRIKQRRLNEIGVTPHPGTKVGDYVPFYFCPRSIMLYMIYRSNDPDLVYRGGQGPIIHLCADLHRVVDLANQQEQKWAFTLSNAGSHYVRFRSTLDQLDDLDWEAIGAHDFREPRIKEGKQAEFLVLGYLPFELIERIGVRSREVQTQALVTLRSTSHSPPVDVVPDWYY